MVSQEQLDERERERGARSEPESPRFPALSRWETVGILAFGVTHFLVGVGPIWRHPWEPNASILWSYLPLPFLVALVLLLRKRLSLATFAFDTFRVLVFKFLITAFILVGLWSATSPTAKTRSQAPATTGSVVDQGAWLLVGGKGALPAPSALDESSLGTVEGKAKPGAWVMVTAGLESFTFAPRTDRVTLRHDGHGFLPSQVVVQVGQPLEVLSVDRKLHTWLALDAGGRQLASAPIVAMGQRVVAFMEPLGTVFVHCAVHPEESSAKIIVLAHPFFAQAEADGSFRLARVPAGKVRIGLGRAAGRDEVEVMIPRTGTARLDLP